MEIVITGSSSGIGKGLAEYYLERGFTVHGIARRKTIGHPAYSHRSIDLSEPDFIEQLDFEPGKDYLLINNAGILGNVGRLTQQPETDIRKVFQVNVFAAVELMQYFSKLTATGGQLTVVNISSGAGRNPLASWLSYCSSKAALDMASQVFYLEEKELGRPTKVYAVAPGIVDTAMQEQIRQTDSGGFSALERFVSYKDNNELTMPTDLGKKLDALLDAEYAGNVLCSLRDF